MTKGLRGRTKAERSSCVASLLAACVLLAPAGAHAQDSEADPAPEQPAATPAETSSTAAAPEAPAPVEDTESRARALAAEGAGFFRGGQYLQAIEAFQSAYDLAPRPALAFNLARSHERLSQWEEAIEWYEVYLKGATDVRDRTEVLDKIELLKKRLGPDESSPEAMYKARILAGRKAYTAGDFEGAIAEFKAAFDIKSTTGPLYNIARSYEKMARYEEAIDYYQQYLDLEPNAADRGDIEENIKRLKRSIRARYQELSVASDPPGADIYLDDRNTGLQGQTNFRFKVTPGPHTLYIDLNGYEPVKREFVMPDDKPLALDFKLQQLENVGTLDIVVSQDGARIFVDGAIIGLSPYRQTKQLEAGPHQVQVELRGYDRWSGEVIIAKDETKVLKVDLVEYEPPVADDTLSAWGRNLMLAGIIGGGLGFAGPIVYQKLIKQRLYFDQLGPNALDGNPFYEGPISTKTDARYVPNAELETLRLTQMISVIAGGALTVGGFVFYLYKWLRDVPPAPITAEHNPSRPFDVSVDSFGAYPTADGAAVGISGSF